LFSRGLNRAVEYSLFVIGFTLTGVVAAQVFYRYALNHSLFWSEELARYLLVWLSFLGASAAYYRKVHPGIDILYRQMPAHVRKASRMGVHGVSLLLFAIMIYYGAQFAYFVRMQISPALYLPKWIVFSIIPISGTILLVHGLSLLLDDLKGIGRDH
jgi:TRAP-type C4-dicarboxylate transport system permease small subunit